MVKIAQPFPIISAGRQNPRISFSMLAFGREAFVVLNSKLKKSECRLRGLLPFG